MAGIPRRLLATTAIVSAMVVGLTACGSGKADKSSAATAPAGGGTQAAAVLPASIRSAGILRVGTNVPFVPMEQYGADGKTFTGIDLDLVSALARQLGLKVQIVNASWDGLIPSLNAGRYDVLAASFGDFVERQKVVDLIDMLHGGVAGIARAGDVAKYTEPTALCGATVGAESGSATVAIAKTLSEKCQSQGKPAITQRVFPTDANAVVALQSGRVDVVLDDRVVAEHLAATQASRYGVVMPNLGTPFLYAFVVSKKNPQLTKALSAALDQLIANGTYARICGSYGIGGQSLVTKATVNAGTGSVNDA